MGSAPTSPGVKAMFQQFDRIPSDAPVQAKPRAIAVPIAKPARRLRGQTIAGLGIVAFSLITIGYQVGRALDSLALGVLAADFAFLGVAAFWAAVSNRR